jgi:hypothetical protein
MSFTIGKSFTSVRYSVVFTVLERDDPAAKALNVKSTTTKHEYLWRASL